MSLTVTFIDPDRRLAFAVAVDCTVRPGMRPRAGWRDGGSAGEPPAIEIEGVRCLAVYVSCGSSLLMAQTSSRRQRALQDRLGHWCLEEYPAEIESAIWQKLGDLPPVAIGGCR